MELLCPECLAPFEFADGQTARCTKHDGEYQILFMREPVPVPAVAPPVAIPMAIPVAEAPPLRLQTRTVCIQHPSVAASYTCRSCGAAICSTCDFPQPDGGHACPNCAVQSATPSPVMNPGVRLPSGVRCVQHMNLPATAQCKLCGAFMCRTCTFDLSGGLKICPECATATPKLSPARKRLLIGAFVLAVWCTIASLAIYGGIFRGLIHDKESRAMVGWLVLALLPLPSLIGLTLSISTMERRSPNPMAMWIATAWNGIILAAFLCLFIKGLFSGGAR